MIVVDASAVVAMWFGEPAGRALQPRFFERAEARGEPVVAPELLALELANVLLSLRRRARQSASGSRAAAASHLAQIDADSLHSEISVVLDAFAVELETAMPRQILAKTLGLADRLGLTAYDGVYLEAAWRLGATLCSLDEPLLAAARELGLRTLQDPT